MPSLDLDLLLLLIGVAQATVALLFAAILRTYAMRPAALVGLHHWSAAMFCLIFCELGDLLGHRWNNALPLTLAIFTATCAWLHFCLLMVGTVEFTSFRATNRRKLLVVVSSALLAAVATVMLSRGIAGSHAAFLRTGLHSWFAALVVLGAGIWLVHHSPRPRSLGAWLFFTGTVLFFCSSGYHGFQCLFELELGASNRYLDALDPCIHATIGTGMVMLVIDRYWAASQHSGEQLHLQEAELRNAHRLEAVGALAGGVAHEYNNLNTAISSHADFLADAVRDNPQALADVAAIHRATERATTLTRKLLAFSRSQELRPQLENVNTILEGIARSMKQTLGSRVELVFHLHPKLPLTRVDRSEIELAFMNLAVNAREALQGGTANGEAGRLDVRTLAVEMRDRSMPTGLRLTPGHYAVVQFTDNGRGMDEETRVRALEPFFSTKAEIANTESGLLPGLGLSSVYGIVRQLGGDVLLSSQPLRGTTISLYLPIADRPDPAPAHAPARSSSSAKSQGSTALVIDHERAIALSIVRALKSSAFKVLTANNGVDALMLAQHYSGTIDLLITDLVMPGMSGEALTKALQAHHPNLRTLYISGHSAVDLLARGIASPGPNVLSKPFSSAELIGKVRQLLEEQVFEASK